MRPTLLAAALALGAPCAVRAASSGPELGLRAGFSLPFGKIAADSASSLSDAFQGFVPLGVEAGWRFIPELYAGVAITYAFGVPEDCPSGFSCSGHSTTLEIALRYHLLRGGQTEPWFGIGVGYEWLGLSATGSGTSADAGVDGFEFLHAEVGTDFAASRIVRVGPFLQFGVGQYSNANTSSGGASVSQTIANKAVHGFVTLGFRVSLLP